MRFYHLVNHPILGTGIHYAARGCANTEFERFNNALPGVPSASQETLLWMEAREKLKKNPRLRRRGHRYANLLLEVT